MEIFPLVGVRGRSTRSVNLGPPYMSESITDGKLKFKTHTYIGPSTHLRYGNFSVRAWGRSARTVHLGPPPISETITARNLKC